MEPSFTVSTVPASIDYRKEEVMGWKATALEDLQMHLLNEQERYRKYSCLPHHEGGAILLKQILAEVDRRAERERKAEWACADCGRPAPIHVFIPETDWRMIRPRDRDQGGVLCLYCMCERLTNGGVADGSLRNALTFSNGPFSAFAASVDRSPEGGGHEDGRHAKHESAVPEGQTPNTRPSD